MLQVAEKRSSQIWGRRSFQKQLTAAHIQQGGLAEVRKTSNVVFDLLLYLSTMPAENAKTVTVFLNLQEA
jgi:hypothetical protein